MHELWLCKNILAIIKQKSAKNLKIKKIYLEIGELMAVDQDSLIFNFNIISQNSIAKGASLIIKKIAGKGTCDQCQKTVKIKHYSDPCQYCGNFSLTITCGEELQVKSMEVE